MYEIDIHLVSNFLIDFLYFLLFYFSNKLCKIIACINIFIFYICFIFYIFSTNSREYYVDIIGNHGQNLIALLHDENLHILNPARNLVDKL